MTPKLFFVKKKKDSSRGMVLPGQGHDQVKRLLKHGHNISVYIVLRDVSRFSEN